jgi:type IV pilus assembly protein PilV
MLNMKHAPIKYSLSGFSLIEVLITIVILSFGLLGLAALQAKTQIAEGESFQRAQALLLVQDMADRISANRLNARADSSIYETSASAPLGDDGQQQDCSGKTTTADIDKCEWTNELVGAGEMKSGTTTAVGAMVGARGCIKKVSTAASPVVIRVSVAWQGMSALRAPTIDCGKDKYGDDGNRRAMSILVSIT